MDLAVDAIGTVKDGVQSEATDQLVDSIWRQFGYVWNYRSNIQDLKAQAERLKAEKLSLQHKVHEARRNGEEIEPMVTTWLVTADETTKAAQQILDEIERSKQINSCIGIMSSNFKTRYFLSRKASKETPGIIEVRKEGTRFDKISYQTPTAMLRLKTIRGYESFESRTLIFVQITEELKNRDSCLIGVYGISGVGKTLLSKKIAEKVTKDGIFKLAITVTLTANQELREIQREIADWLDLKFDTESTQIRSARLRRRIKDEANILIILDNVCERIFQLEDIGIPSGDDHKSCKVLVTSRNWRVLSEIGVEKSFELEVLKEEEAWQLFKKKLSGNPNSNDSDFQTLAMDVVKRCGGLPAMIEAVGNALINKEDYEWKDFLNKLKQDEKPQFDEKIKFVLQH